MIYSNTIIPDPLEKSLTSSMVSSPQRLVPSRPSRLSLESNVCTASQDESPTGNVTFGVNSTAHNDGWLKETFESLKKRDNVNDIDSSTHDFQSNHLHSPTTSAGDKVQKILPVKESYSLDNKENDCLVSNRRTQKRKSKHRIPSPLRDFNWTGKQSTIEHPPLKKDYRRDLSSR
eukprot:6312205-Ditylum_brightwellii.AAC.1